MEKQRIQIITQRVYIVNEDGKKRFKNEKPLMAITDEQEAIEQMELWNNDEKKINKRYKGMYHLEFIYKLTEVTLY